jgi:hypothetical protein
MAAQWIVKSGEQHMGAGGSGWGLNGGSDWGLDGARRGAREDIGLFIASITPLHFRAASLSLMLRLPVVQAVKTQSPLTAI